MPPADRMYRSWFSRAEGLGDHLIARWLFLRALGLIYFSAFFALLFQVKGLIGTSGILPAKEYLQALSQQGALRFWYAPTLLWISSGDHMLMALCWIGLIASLLVVANLAPRWMLVVCFVCFLSFTGAAQDFAGYQSDGMLLEAGFLALFIAPAGLWPRWGEMSLPRRAAWFLLIWEWFRIYFESGVVKLASGDPTWRNLTAMYAYYQNGPLPTWIGWYLQHLPHWFQRSSAGATLIMELLLVWMVFFGRRWRIVCFFIVTVWQIGVIATANYAFLNYLVLVLAFLLLDDRFLRRLVPLHWWPASARAVPALHEPPLQVESRKDEHRVNSEADTGEGYTSEARSRYARVRTAAAAVMLTWIAYATTVPLVEMFWASAPLPTAPIAALDPLRIANTYGLFATMTPERYEIEFQGSNDGAHWAAYPFRYKPQDLAARPRIYAPYQPRFDWNLWFASLGTWQQNPMVPRTEELLLSEDRDVLGLFAGNPFSSAPPRYVRAVLWQYWFTTWAEKRATGAWWTRKLLGAYAPTITRLPDGKFAAVEESAPPDTP